MLSSWSADNSIIVTPAKAPQSHLASVFQTAFSPVIFKSDYGYDNKYVRKLLNESQGIFSRFLDVVKKSDSKTASSQVLRAASKEFRVCIRACCQALEKDFVEIQANKLRYENYEQLLARTESLLQMYRRIEIVWVLADVLFFRPKNSLLITDLLEWSRWCFVEQDVAANELVKWSSEGRAKLETHNKYWTTIYEFLLTGRTEEARRLIGAHSKFQSSGALKSIFEMMGRMPLSKLDTEEGKEAFAAWQIEVRRRRKNGDYPASMWPELDWAIQFMIGGEEAFGMLASGCSCKWYQTLVGRALFMHPFAKIFDLAGLAEECIAIHPTAKQNWTTFDSTVQSLFQLDILNGLKQVCASFANWWCAAHLGVLLRFGGSAELFIFENNVDLHEYLLLQYGESLMTDGRGLWQIGVDYLAACPTSGKDALGSILERMPLDAKDTHKTLKIIEICRQLKLFGTLRTICKEKSRTALKAGNIPDALTWSLQPRLIQRSDENGEFIDYISERILREHCNNRCIDQLQILDNLGENALASPLLTFICKYRKMHTLRESGHYKDSICVLSDLIASQISPRVFWRVLFEDALDLLKHVGQDVTKDDAEDMLKIMKVMQDSLIQSEFFERSFFNTPEDKGLFNDTVKKLAVQITKYLSAALKQKHS